MMEAVTIKSQGFINVAMVLLSWLTLPLLGSRKIKKFLPATLLILFIEILHSGYGKKQKWWVFYNKPNTRLFGELPLNIGPFLVISLWFLKWTYGSFKRYILLNGITNAIFAYPITFFARKWRYFTLVRINNFQFFVFFFFKAFLLYGFQYFIETIRKFNSEL